MLENGTGEGDAVVFVLDAHGGVVDHEYVQPAGNGGAGAGGLLGAAVNRYTGQIGSVNVIKAKPGEMAPGPVQMVLVQLRDDGNSPSRTGSVAVTPDGRVAVSTRESHGNTEGLPTTGEIGAAIHRFYTPEMGASGLTGDVRVTYRFGPDGKATDVRVTAIPAGLEAVGRQIAGALDLRPGKPNTDAQVWFSLGPAKISASR